MCNFHVLKSLKKPFSILRSSVSATVFAFDIPALLPKNFLHAVDTLGQSNPSNLEWKLSLTETEPILADKYLTFGVGWEKAALCWPWWIDYHDTPSTPDTGQVPRTIRLRTRIRLKKHHQQLGLPLPFQFPLAFPFRFQAKWNPVGVGAGGECIVDVDVIGRRCEVCSYG